MIEPSNHFKDGKSTLTLREAKEQLLYENRSLNGAHFDVERYPDRPDCAGVVMLKVGTVEQDHYKFYESSEVSD